MSIMARHFTFRQLMRLFTTNFTCCRKIRIRFIHTYKCLPSGKSLPCMSLKELIRIIVRIYRCYYRPIGYIQSISLCTTPPRRDSSSSYSSSDIVISMLPTQNPSSLASPKVLTPYLLQGEILQVPLYLYYMKSY